MKERMNDKVPLVELACKIARTCRAIFGTFVARVAADLLRHETNVILERARTGPDMPPREPDDYPYMQVVPRKAVPS